MKFSMLYIFFIVFCLQLNAQQASKERAETLEAVTQPQRKTNAEVLNFEVLAAYEQHGIQKIKDFFDYQNIIGNKEYDLVFREHALQLALDLFHSKKEKISVLKIQEKKIDIHRYLNNFLHHSYIKVEFEITDIKTVARLQADRQHDYISTIEYQIVVKITEESRVSKFSCTYLTDIALNKVSKQFGQREEEIWQVRLGTIHMKE